MAPQTEISPPSTSTKPVHILLLDSSPLLLNTPSLSTLLSQSDTLVSTPSVISEIRDPVARSRVETTYLPFLTLRSPKPESVKFVKEFARRTGDAAVLSNTDLEVLGLAYELECERNGGDWRLRRAPGQKGVNGKPPAKDAAVEKSEGVESGSVEALRKEVEGARISDDPSTALDTEAQKKSPTAVPEMEDGEEEEPEAEESDSEGWITPSNIKKRQAEDDMAAESSKTETKVLQVATMTGDFAMQNVLLQVNLNLLSPKTCKRIQNVRTTVLRCHGCFATTKEMNKQFCSRCGKPTLTRVSCTTNDRGEVKLHLKQNMQWNNKGNVFSIPKPTSGRSNQRWQGPQDGGGKGGWGNNLILAEDQKEYVRAMTTEGRTKNKDLMDEDFLPSILSGDRRSGGGRPKVGGGRNINSRKR